MRMSTLLAVSGTHAEATVAAFPPSIEGLDTFTLRVTPVGEILYLNQPFARYLNTPREELVGKSLSLLRRMASPLADALHLLSTDETASFREVQAHDGRRFSVRVA